MASWGSLMPRSMFVPMMVSAHLNVVDAKESPNVKSVVRVWHASVRYVPGLLWTVSRSAWHLGFRSSCVRPWLCARRDCPSPRHQTDPRSRGAIEGRRDLAPAHLCCLVTRSREGDCLWRANGIVGDDYTCGGQSLERRIETHQDGAGGFHGQGVATSRRNLER
jgi:hypothetical protein